MSPSPQGWMASDLDHYPSGVRRFDLMLRAPDALHIALCRRGDLTLVTLDRRRTQAAEALG